MRQNEIMKNLPVSARKTQARLRAAGMTAIALGCQLLLRSRLLTCAALLLVAGVNSVFAQAGGGGGSFSSTDLKTGISNSLAVIMLFGFVLGIAAVIAGGFAIRRGDVDTGKLSIIGGAVIAAAPAIAFAFFKIFGLDSNSTVGVGQF